MFWLNSVGQNYFAMTLWRSLTLRYGKINIKNTRILQWTSDNVCYSFRCYSILESTDSEEWERWYFRFRRYCTVQCLIILADFGVFDWWRYCKALCDERFRQIEGKGRKFSHIELSSSVIKFSNRVITVDAIVCFKIWQGNH